jgi:hypothetical protein
VFGLVGQCLTRPATAPEYGRSSWVRIDAGVNAKALSAYMGHSSIDVTFDLYGHLMPGSEAEAASLLEAYLQRKRTDMRAGELSTPERANKTPS